MLAKIDTENRQYVIDHGHCITSLGFDYAYNQATKVALWVKTMLPEITWVGTRAGYTEYLHILALGEEKYRKTKERCEANLDPMFTPHLGKRVEALDKDGEKSRFIVGRSSGWMPVYLELKRRDSSGGCAILSGWYVSVRRVN